MITYTDRQGRTVQVNEYEKEGTRPVFDAEVIRNGEVVEYIDRVVGHFALMYLAKNRGWRPNAT